MKKILCVFLVFSAVTARVNGEDLLLTARVGDVATKLNDESASTYDQVRLDARRGKDGPLEARLTIEEDAKTTIGFLTLNENNGDDDSTAGNVAVYQLGGNVTVSGPIRFARDPSTSAYYLQGGMLRHTGQGGGKAIRMRGDRPGARAIFHVSGGQFVGRNRIDMGAADSRVVISGGSFMLASHVDMGYASRDGAESLLHIVGSAPQQVVITSLLCSRHVENRLGAATLKFTLDESGVTPVYVMRLFGASAGDKLVVDVSRYRGRDEEIVLVDYERMDGRQWQSADIKIVGGTASVKFDGGDGTAVVLEDIRRADVR